jgi:hypothetical protein
MEMEEETNSTSCRLPPTPPPLSGSARLHHCAHATYCLQVTLENQMRWSRRAVAPATSLTESAQMHHRTNAPLYKCTIVQMPRSVHR